jgi:hypothetical protein
MSSLAKLPDGVVLTPLSARVFNILAAETAFPWAVMVAQCKRCSCDPTALTPGDLKTVLPFLSQGVARFTSPEKGERVRGELEKLIPMR